MKTRVVGLVAGIGMLWAGRGWTEEGPLTLERALELARTSSGRAEAASAKASAASDRIRVAESEFLPSLGARYGYLKSDGDVFFSRFVNPEALGQLNPAGGATDIGSFDETHSFTISMRQSVFAGGAHAAEVESQRIESRIADQEKREELAQVRFETTKAFYDVLLAERRLAAAGDSIRRSEANLETVSKRAEEEEALRVETLGAEALLAADRQAEAAAAYALADARLELNRLLGRDLRAEVELAGDLEGTASGEVDREAVLAEALAANAGVERARLAVELAGSAWRRARAAILPKVHAEARATYGDNDLIFRGWAYGGGVSVSIPFLKDVYGGLGAISAADAREHAAEVTLAEIEPEIEARVEQILHAIDESVRAAEAAEKNLAYRAEKHRIARISYGENLATFADVLDESRNLSQATVERDRALHAARVAQAKLDLLRGRE